MAELKDYGSSQVDATIKPCSCGCYCCCICVFGYDSIGSIVVMVGAEAVMTTGSFLIRQVEISAV